MKLPLSFLSLLIFSMLFCKRSEAQATISRLEVAIAGISLDTTSLGEGLSNVSISETKTLYFEVSDTADIATVSIKLGTIENGEDILNESFNGLGLTEVSPDVWFHRTGIVCKAGIKTWVNIDQCYLSIHLLDGSGNVLGSYSGIAY